MRRFNTTQICNIRHMVNVENLSVSEVARMFKASRSSIRDITNMKTYRDIPEAKIAPQFPNYLVYPNGNVFSLRANQFIIPSRKSISNPSIYVNLRNGELRKSFKINELIGRLF